MYKRRPSHYRRRPRKYARRPRKGAKKGSTGLRRVIRKVMKSTAEHKHQILTINPYIVIGNGATGVNLNNTNLIPSLSQGTGQGNRVGNRIKVTSMNFRGFIYLNPAYGSSLNRQLAPVWVKFFLLESKQYKGNSTNLNANDQTVLFDAGNVDGTFQGTMADMILPLNTDRFIIHATKMWKLNPSLSQVSGQTAGTIPLSTFPAQGNGTSATNQASSQHYFNFNLKNMAKNFQYDQNSQYPTNHNLILVYQAVYADGTQVTNNVEQPALITGLVEMKYTDI